MRVFPEEIWNQEVVVHFKRLPNDKNAICFEGKRCILIISVDGKGSKVMNFQSKMIRYQWTEDGVIEICKMEEGVLLEEKRCYHCNRKMEKGEKVMVLFPQDGDEYTLCLNCVEKACNLI